jgi:hypothetical protein
MPRLRLGSAMDNDPVKALEYLRQAEALRKIASEMQTCDKDAAENLIELAGIYEARASGLTPPHKRHYSPNPRG